MTIIEEYLAARLRLTEMVFKPGTWTPDEYDAVDAKAEALWMRMATSERTTAADAYCVGADRLWNERMAAMPRIARGK